MKAKPKTRGIAKWNSTDRKMRRVAEEWKIPFDVIFDSIADLISIQDKNFKLVKVNKAYTDTFRIKPEKLFGKTCYEVVHEIKKPYPGCPHKEVLKTRKPLRIEFFEPRLGIYFDVRVSPIFNEKSEAICTLHIAKDITERKNAEKELQEQKLALEKKNMAFKEVLEQVQIAKNGLKDDIVANVNETLIPILEKLMLKKAPRKYVDLLRRHLEELTSSYARKITEKSINLTPREIEICNMIKGGLTTKEISRLLNISRQTIDKHRKNIRKKLHISKDHINLSSFLQST